MNTQLEQHKDVCKCRGCGVESSITIVPELPKNKWRCNNCNLLQMWIPSKSYASKYIVITETKKAERMGTSQLGLGI